MDVGQPVNLATALVPPSNFMMSETVMETDCTENRKVCKPVVSDCVIYAPEQSRQAIRVLTTAELLARLRDKGVKNADIARALNVTPSRVTELYDGQRALKLDEAVKLAAAFELESPPVQRVSPLPSPIARLIVDHIARELAAPVAADEEKLADLAEDIRAFAEFVTDPKVRESVDLAMAFFQAMRLRRPAPEAVS